jgi:phage repressor protein C with HTH and peptisase S24 domain/DNA-binding XRE family transcriptional regulator
MTNIIHVDRNMRSLNANCKRFLRTDKSCEFVQIANMEDLPLAANKLKALRESTGLSIREIAQRIGVSASSYQHYENPERFKKPFLPYEFAWNVAQALKPEGSDFMAQALSLALGRESQALHSLLRGETPTRVEYGEEVPEGSSLVPVYDVEASAGHGAIVESEFVAHSLAFPPEYLRRLTSTDPKNLRIISVKGDSMEPTLLDDDIVMLDESKRDLGFDGLFVLEFDSRLHVKRVARSPKPGHVKIISDNRALYDPEDYALQDVRPIGKVLWYGRKV